MNNFTMDYHSSILKSLKEQNREGVTDHYLSALGSCLHYNNLL